MPIQIIDNFELTSAKPIDNRLVVGPNSFYTNKDDITNKYNGLRIWELPGSNIGGGLTNSTPSGVSYVWTGSAWINENTTGISGGGDSGRVPYFNSSNSIQSSNIYYNGTNIGIGISAETVPGSKLVVGGSIKSNGGYFIGNAWDSSTSTGLSNLNATNLSIGTIPIGRFPTSTTGWILTADSAAASYKDPSSITVGTASALQTTRTIWGQNFNGTGNVTGNLSSVGNINFSSDASIISTTGNYTINNTNEPSTTNKLIIKANSTNGIIIYTPNANNQSIGDIKIRPGVLQSGSMVGRSGSLILENSVQVLCEDSTILINRTFSSMSYLSDVYFIPKSAVSPSSTFSTSNHLHISQNYDRIININLVTSVPFTYVIGVLIQPDPTSADPTNGGTDWINWDLVNATLAYDEGACSFLVPAGCKFILYLKPTTSITTIITIKLLQRRFGRTDNGYNSNTN